MINPHKEIFLFLEGKSEQGFKIISNIFNKKLNHSYDFLKEHFEAEDLFMEFIEKLWEKRNYLTCIFENQDNGLPAYIRQMVSNFLKDKIKQMSEKNENIVFSSEDKSNEILIKIEAMKLEEILNRKLKNEDFKVLCYMITEGKHKTFYEEKHFSDINKNALYKRVQRMKEKLKDIILGYGFEIEVVEFYIENLLPYQCKRRKLYE